MDKRVIVTIITPTYNRKNTLPALVESLCKQTRKNFQWIVIDDGSIDGTSDYIEKLKTQKWPFEWEYYYKINGGKHSALNAAHAYIKGELVLILDSDDYLTEDAVETIEEEWEAYREHQDICGMSYLKGKVDGSYLSRKNQKEFYIDDDIHYRINKNIKGDRCEVIRTNILKNYPFPIHVGEKFLPESWLWNKVALNYKTVYRNKVIYICEYLDDGLTKSGRALRMKSPLGMMDNCSTYFMKCVCKKRQLKEMILYWVYAKCAGYSFVETLKKSGCRFEMFLTMVPGYIVYFYWKRKYL